MRQRHRAGEKFFVDYSGKKLSYIDPVSGEIIPVELFVGVMGASNYTYAEATRTQQGPDWIASHQRAFAFLRGVPEAVVCDCLKSGVVEPCRYEPGLQRTYEELIQHYGAVILPTRPHAPGTKRKSKREFWWPNAGSSPGCGMRPSFPSRPSTPASPSSSTS